MDNGDIFRERIREVVQARIGDYLPNQRNPKIHGELQNERLRAILENWGKVGVLLTFKDDDGRDVLMYDPVTALPTKMGSLSLCR